MKQTLPEIFARRGLLGRALRRDLWEAGGTQDRAGAEAGCSAVTAPWSADSWGALQLGERKTAALGRGPAAETKAGVPAYRTPRDCYIPAREAEPIPHGARLPGGVLWGCGNSCEFKPWLLGTATTRCGDSSN